MGSNLNKYWELHSGGESGQIFFDAGISTAILTGMQSDYITVHRAVVFDVLSVTSNFTPTAINFKVENLLTGITLVAGTKVFAGYGRYFNSMQISTGQLSYVNVRND